MEIVVRAAVLYFFLLLLFRAAGKRTLAQITVFDVVLLFVIGEVAGPAILAGEASLTGAALAVVTLVGIDVGLSVVKRSSKTIDRLLDGVPVVVVKDGRPDREAMRRERVDTDDVLAAARQSRGVDRIEAIEVAVLERGGQISVIPR
jgi:uncharacterized membrane protein YcaP (DUF421 family)